MISHAFIPFLIQEHEASYKHALSLKAPSNLTLIFPGGSTEQGVRWFVQSHSRSQWREQTKKPPTLCFLKNMTAGAYSVVYFSHLHKNWQINLKEEREGSLKVLPQNNTKTSDPLKPNWEAEGLQETSRYFSLQKGGSKYTGKPPHPMSSFKQAQFASQRLIIT